MYDGKARNAIIKYELKQFHEGNNDGNDDVENELVIDEDECGDGGDDSLTTLMNPSMNLRMKKSSGTPL